MVPAMQLPSVAIALCLTVGNGGAAWAAAGTSTLTAQTTVALSCTVSTASIVFGNYNPVGTHLTSDLLNSGSVTITCVKDSTPTVALSLGNNASGSTRRMFDATASDYLNYELYQSGTTPNTACPASSVAGLTVWGTAGANLLAPGKATSKSARTYNVCGAVPQAQNPSIGTNYADTVVVTVNF